MSNSINVGSTVYLKSGGPLMTVGPLSYVSDGTSTCECYWFDDNGELQTTTFPILAVCLADTNVPSPVEGTHAPKRFADELPPDDGSKVLVWGDHGDPNWGAWAKNYKTWSEEFRHYQTMLVNAWWMPAPPDPK
jgi:uncharacterized protein YodC (DUF2158 family)